MAGTTKSSTTKKTSTKAAAAAKKAPVKNVKSDAHIPIDMKPVAKGLPIKKITAALQDREELSKKMAEKKEVQSGKKRISITLTENQAEALKILAKAHDCSIGDLVGNELLIMYLSNSSEDMKFMALMHHDLIEQVIVGN
jgi:hypothetical protein